MDLGLNSAEISGISDISPPRGGHVPAMVAMARSMGDYDDCRDESGDSLRVMQLELEAEEAELNTRRAAQAIAEQERIVAARRLRIELARSDAGSNRSRSRIQQPGLGSTIRLMMDLMLDGSLSLVALIDVITPLINAATYGYNLRDLYN